MIELRADRLIGREIHAPDGRRAGRLEEFHTELRGADRIVTGYAIGAAGLIERLGLGFKLLLGRTNRGKVARWDQLDLRDPEHPRLTCPVEDLRSA